MTQLHQLAQRYWRITWLLMLAWPAWWALDRKPPLRQLAPATYTAVRPGGTTVIVLPSVERDLDRDCSVRWSQHLYDGQGTRHNLASGYQTSAGLIEQAQRMGNTLRMAVPISPAAAPGSALWISQLEYRCNPIHTLAPIEVQLSIPLEISP
jgi:hypothetical protein